MAKDTTMYLRPLKSGRRSKVAEDAEVRAVVDELDGKGLTLDEIHRDVAARFAQERVPSRSALHRYMASRRNGLEGTLQSIEEARSALARGKVPAAIGHLERALDGLWERVQVKS